MARSPTYSNPPEEVNSRPYEPIDGISNIVKDNVHQEATSSNPRAYCRAHHTLETRTTKSKHSTCEIISSTEMKGNNIVNHHSINFLGKTKDETWANFIKISRESGHIDNQDQIRTLFIRKYQDHSSKIKSKKNTQHPSSLPLNSGSQPNSNINQLPSA